MKKILLFSVVFILALTFVGCDVSGDVIGAYILVVNPDWHDKGVFRVGFADEEVLKEKYVDIWIKSDTNALIKINEEFSDPFEFEVIKDEWYSLTTEIDRAMGKENEEDFFLYKEAVLRTFTLVSDSELVITVKAVVGDREQNFLQSGWLLTNRKDVSREVSLKIRPKG